MIYEMAELYQRKVAKLEQTLNDPQMRAEAAEILRSLIDRIVIKPTRDSGFVAELYGELGAILTPGAKNASTPGTGSAGVQVSLVAGTRIGQYSTSGKWLEKLMKLPWRLDRTVHRVPRATAMEQASGNCDGGPRGRLDGTDQSRLE